MIARFLVPVVDNAGKPYSKAHWEILESDLLRIAGGFTRLGFMTGAWCHPDTGKVVDESIRGYEIALDEPKLSELDTFLAKLAAAWGQYSIYRVICHTDAECIEAKA